MPATDARDARGMPCHSANGFAGMARSYHGVFVRG